MEARELCKNSEGDPATPGLAATTCWGRSQSINYVAVCIRLGQDKVSDTFFTSQRESGGPFPSTNPTHGLDRRCYEQLYTLNRIRAYL